MNQINFSIPMYTRAKQLVSTTGYTGNNPYVAYQRKSIVKFTATYVENNETKTIVQNSDIRQVRRVPDHKKYISSRNLVRVQPKDRIAMSEAEVRVPKGGVLLFREAYHPGLSQYIRYILPENRRKRPPGTAGKTE